MSELKAPACFGVVHDDGLEKTVLERRLVVMKVEYISATETRVWFLHAHSLLPFADVVNPVLITPDSPVFHTMLALPMRPTP